MNAILRLGVCLMLAALAGCATHDRRLTSSTTRYLTSGGDVVAKPSSVGINDTVSYWDGDGVSGSPSITINLGEQKAFFYKDGRLVGVSMISSGREGYRTPPGQYKVSIEAASYKKHTQSMRIKGNGVSVLNADMRSQ